MKTRKRYIPIFLGICASVIFIVLLCNNLIISTGIYYSINYRGEVHNLEKLIDKSESFEYEKYCQYHGYTGEIQNITESTHSSYIDRERINSLKQRIERDKSAFHIFHSYKHNFNYSFNATNESIIRLTYNNNSIIEATYEDGKKIFTAENSSEFSENLFWMGIWYLNFSQIPYPSNEQTTVTLNNVFLVKMSFKYAHFYANLGAQFYEIRQFIAFNSDLEPIFVYLPLTEILMA